MIWLLPAAACSITIAVILKINEGRGGSRLVMMGANYIVASLLAFALIRGDMGATDRTTVLFGAGTGAVYVLSFLVFMAGIGRGPLAVPVTVMRLSVVVPVVTAIFAWNESPGLARWLGIILGLGAILFFGAGVAGGRTEAARGTSRTFWLLMAGLFLSMGLASVLLKTFGVVSPGAPRMPFTWLLFTFAGVFTWIVILARRLTLDRRTFALGLALGVPNLFSTVFTLRALQSVPASVVFPFINVTVIFGATLLGLVVWRERLGRLSITGLVLAAVALLLLAR
ncbi:MAG TPA: hypothetical protein VLA34_07755 [Candidatus Krumholzibacterium sp.]|nr:hypothetical protein [Candidatus Krumholzibacterium sp.]